MTGSSLTQLSIMHICLEAATAISVGSGRSEGHEDAPILLDAFGLPTIPGSTLAGVLRSLYRPEPDQPSEDHLFGYAKGETGASSRIEVSNGYLHDSQNRPSPVPKLNDDGSCADALLARFQQIYEQAPVRRHRTKISESGVADSEVGALFDRTVVPRGARFTFEIALWGAPEAAASRQGPLELLQSSMGSAEFRLGGGTRAGLGAVRSLASRLWTFDLTDVASHEAYGKAFLDLQTFSLPLQPLAAGRRHDWRIKISPTDFWRIGNSETAIPQGADHADADLAPYVEDQIVWEADAPKWKRCLLVPASSVKGALRHRTAFHFDRLRGRFLNADDPLQRIEGTDSNPAVMDLFGSVKSKSGGARGRVIIDDAAIELAPGTKLQTIMHNSIDRFTGGVRDGFLYGEQMIWKGEFQLNISLLGKDSPVSELAERAFRMALDDLMNRRLAIGAGGGRGHGRIQGAFA